MNKKAYQPITYTTPAAQCVVTYAIIVMYMSQPPSYLVGLAVELMNHRRYAHLSSTVNF